ncbi:replication protein, partial [Lactococcus lactis]
MTTGAERGQQLFADLLETMQRTTATMERLDAEQKNQCRIIEQAS